MTRNLKARLRSCELTLGSWITLGHPAIAEIMGRAGFDWITIDLEHTVIDFSAMQELIRTVDLLGITPLVRISRNDPVEIKRVLDAGAGGIIVPNIRTAEEVHEIVNSSYYPPKGNRGVGLARAQGYGASFNDYKSFLAHELVIIVQIEHIDAVKNIRSILAVPEVDAFLVGPYDLSGSIGDPGNFESSQFKSLIEQISNAALELGKCSGIHVVEPNLERVQEVIAKGYKMVAYSADIRMIDDICRQALSHLKRD